MGARGLTNGRVYESCDSCDNLTSEIWAGQVGESPDKSDRALRVRSAEFGVRKLETGRMPVLRHFPTCALESRDAYFARIFLHYL